MKCDHPDCTGRHSSSAPADGRCPRASTLRREGKRRQQQTPGTYEYDESHGVGKPGLVVRKLDRARADARDAASLEALVAVIEGTEYGPFD